MRKNGTTILVITNVMDEADRCQRLPMMREGRILATGEIRNRYQVSSILLRQRFPSQTGQMVKVHLNTK
ncbi:MAG: hypothetical protein IKU46_06930 [Peptococcaceae bacterium]|nr:hypothetical protein [Peptococcaceae bacterium]